MKKIRTRLLAFLAALLFATPTLGQVGGGVTIPPNSAAIIAAMTPTTSAQWRAVLSDETGGGLAVFNDTPTLIAPVLGAATGTSLALSGCTISADKLCVTGTIAASGVYTNTQSIAATSTDGIVLQNTTAAANGAQQWSPRLHLIGRGWGTGVNTSQSVDWIMEARPIQGATNPTTSLALASSVNGGAYVDVAVFTNGGGGTGYYLTLGSGLHVTNAADFGVLTGNFTLRADFGMGWGPNSDPTSIDTAFWRTGAAAAQLGGGTAGATGTLKLATLTASANINTTAGTVQYLGTGGGSADVITVTPTIALTAYTTGACYKYLSAAANATTTPTWNASGLGAKTIVKRAATALAAGDIPNASMTELCYTGTNMQLMNPVVN